MVALVVLSLVAVGGFFVFRRVVGSSTRGTAVVAASPSHVPAVTPGVPTPPSPVVVGSPGPLKGLPQPSGQPGLASGVPGSPSGQQPLTLRDLVAGIVAVTSQTSLAMDAEQKKKMGELLPQVQENITGKNASVRDATLENAVLDILTSPQREAVRTWKSQHKDSPEPDYPQEVNKLKQMCGGS